MSDPSPAPSDASPSPGLQPDDERSPTLAPHTRRLWGGFLVLAVAGLAVATFVALLDTARYAWAPGDPVELGALEQGSLGAPNSFVRGQAKLSEQGLRLTRQGAGRFLLAPVQGRSELLILLPIPRGVEDYVPPRSFEGRLIDLQAPGARQRAVAELAQSSQQATLLRGATHLLVHGETPAASGWSLWMSAFLLLVLLGSLAFAIRLWLPLRPAEDPTRQRAVQ